MKQLYLLFSMLTIIIAMLFSGCRPPELEGAIVHFKAGRDDQAYDLAKEATQKYPDNPEAWYYLGEIEGKKNMVEEMVQSFDKSLSLSDTYKKDIEQVKQSYFGKYYNDGVNAYNTFIKLQDREGDDAKKQLNNVIDNFKKALYIRNDFMANRLIAVAYQNLGDDEKNLQYLMAAKDAAPDTILGYVELGYYYSRKKEFSEAATWFKKGLDKDPKNVECMTLYAQNLDFADRKDEAIAAYKEAIKLNPEEKAIPFNLGLLLNKEANATDDEAKKKELMSEAVVYFQKAYELDPGLKDTYDILSTLLLQLERYQEAEAILKEGIERWPDSASMWQNLSFLYAKQGNKAKAEEYYEKSKQLRGE
jgi:tetratricopeptide (TPR) repeat protein